MNSDITGAFFTLINDAALGLPISFEGVKFTPPDSGQWLEVTFLPNQGIDQSMTSNNPVSQGIIQVNACNRPNSGLIPLQKLSETVAALFPKNTIIYDLVRVSETPYTSDMISLDDRLIIPLTIMYSE